LRPGRILVEQVSQIGGIFAGVGNGKQHS
jgi:hypothetical protein